MSNELTVKQERFCHLYLELGNSSEAYRQAFNSSAKPESVHVSASRLLSDDKVRLRVTELKKQLRERNRATLDDILRELDENRAAAQENGQIAAMNQATLGKAKLLGFEKQVLDHISSDGSMKPSVIELVAPTGKNDDSKD